MNKIKIDNNFSGKIINIDSDSIIYYDNCSVKLDIVINKEVRLIEFIDNSNICNNYILNSSLCISRFSNNSSNCDKFNLNICDISLDYFYSCINKDDNVCNVDVIHNKENTNSKIVSHGINLDNNRLEFLIDGIVLKNSSNVTLSQDSKIINMGDNNSGIKPNLIIDNDEIDASHSAYIGDFDKNSIFYLMSRGISYSDSVKVLAKSFLLNDDRFEVLIKDKILNLINEYWR